MKDIFEVIAWFLSRRGVLEIISETFQEISETNIEKEYSILRHCIPGVGLSVPIK